MAAGKVRLFQLTATDVSAFGATSKNQNDGEIFTFPLFFHTLGTQTLHTCSKEKPKMKIRQNYKNREFVGIPLKRRLSGQKLALEPLQACP